MLQLELFSNIPDDTAKINVYVGDDGKLHFVDSEGADSVLPFSSGGGIKLLTTGSGNTTYDATGISGYEKLTADNFIVVKTSASGYHCVQTQINDKYITTYHIFANSYKPSLSYNASTGKLTISGMTVDMYCRYTYSDKSVTTGTTSSSYNWQLYLIN